MSNPPNMKRGRNTEVRILPAVVAVGAILLALKASGLAFDANAAQAPKPAAPAAAAAAAPAAAVVQPVTAAQAPATTTPKAGAPVSRPLPNGTPDPLAAINAALPNANAQTETPTASADPQQTDFAGGLSPAEMDVLTSLADRRDALDERQRELDTKANVLAAAEKRVDDKITQLKTIQAQIEALLGQREAKETAQLDGLVRIYTAMKPKDAARIFGSLNDEVRLGVAGRMKPDAMAGIMSALPADIAQKMTVELASRYKMPADTAAAAKAVTATPPTAPVVPAAPANAKPPASPAPSAQATPAKPPGG
jgi:flagellar motility protein MotE (MotC chaperone)